MRDFLVIYQVETQIRARNQEDAEHRAEEIADRLQVLAPPYDYRKRRWWPETVEITETTVAEGE